MKMLDSMGRLMVSYSIRVLNSIVKRSIADLQDID